MKTQITIEIVLHYMTPATVIVMINNDKTQMLGHVYASTNLRDVITRAAIESGQLDRILHLFFEDICKIAKISKPKSRNHCEYQYILRLGDEESVNAMQNMVRKSFEESGASISGPIELKGQVPFNPNIKIMDMSNSSLKFPESYNIFLVGIR